jgi:Holliday junction DNA helicase RuvA
MIDFIEGDIIEISPAHLVIKTAGIGYFVHISVHSYTHIEKQKQAIVFIHEIIREDTHQLYGFSTKSERDVFELLISVNGVGANTARMILSSLSASEVNATIAAENDTVFKNIKGIGSKTAQRIIIDLKDKVTKLENTNENIKIADNRTREEALSALVMLGFIKKSAEKVVDKLISDNPSMQIEELIKQSLKQL